MLQSHLLKIQIWSVRKNMIYQVKLLGNSSTAYLVMQKSNLEYDSYGERRCGFKIQSTKAPHGPPRGGNPVKSARENRSEATRVTQN